MISPFRSPSITQGNASLFANPALTLADRRPREQYRLRVLSLKIVNAAPPDTRGYVLNGDRSAFAVQPCHLLLVVKGTASVRPSSAKSGWTVPMADSIVPVNGGGLS